jgi:hypothetical protein
MVGILPVPWNPFEGTLDESVGRRFPTGAA